MNPYIKLPRVPLVYGRQDFIVNRCKGRRILHLGCADSGLLHDRFERGDLTHQKLAAVSKELWGVDLDEKGIEYLRHQGFDHLLVGDICSLDTLELLRARTFDTIVASEVIEHLKNPGLFLDGVRKLMIPGETELIVTVPNAFRIDTLFWLFRGVELVHPDHYYWFSYYTARHFLEMGGLMVGEVFVYSFNPKRILTWRTRASDKRIGKESGTSHGTARISERRSFFEKVSGCFWTVLKRLLSSLLLRKTPFWGDGIILVARRPR